MKGVVIQELAELPLNTYLSSGAVAQIFQVCPRTLRRMVIRYDLPEGIRQGKKKLWSVDAILKWLQRLEEKNMERAEQERERIRRYEEGA